jgi:hypothetical protein
MNLFFTFMLRETIHVATELIPRLHMFWPLTLLAGGTLGVTFYYLRKFRQVARDDGDRDPSIEDAP